MRAKLPIVGDPISRYASYSAAQASEGCLVEGNGVQAVNYFLNGAQLFVTPRYEDTRGSFCVTYEAASAAELGMTACFVQDNQSVSRDVGTIRGIHLQLPPFEQGKLVRVLRGRIVDLLVDLRPQSDSFGAHEVIEISAESRRQVWIPRGFGHAFCTLESNTEVFYKVDAPYAPEAERTLAWDDATLAVDWPLRAAKPVLSEKDKNGMAFDELVAEIEARLA